MEVKITTTWDGKDITHPPVSISLAAEDDGCHMTVNAPFFNDPPAPSGERGKPFPCLWDYEVVEAFFLNDKEEYLEVEVCPHGQHLLLLLKGRRNIVQEQLSVKYSASIDGECWKGETTLPYSYFPPNVSKFNAYAIHGSGESRVYESLYPATSGEFDQPDFHRLQFFKSLDVSQVLRNNVTDYDSSVWGKYIDNTS